MEVQACFFSRLDKFTGFHLRYALLRRYIGLDPKLEAVNQLVELNQAGTNCDVLIRLLYSET